jgi:uncharacterized protein (DUF736 family)
MTQIGSFQRTRHGYDGRVHTLGLDAQLYLVAAESSDAENAPDWRIHMGDSEVGPEVGAGWDRIGEKAGAYIALLIDCPTLVQPIRANLFKSGQHEGLHHLVWSRPSRREDRT